jgi:AsmA-like C-terminal region
MPRNLPSNLVMADLSIIYSKTPRGLRARASLVGGLSSHLMKVLSLVDGTSKAEAILLKFDHLTPETLLSELAELEKEGYIKISGNTRPNQEWSPTIHFTPMVVEEYQSEEEVEAIARAKAEQDAKLAADRKANAEAAAQREIERKAQEEKALIQAKSKAKAEAKMKELLEAEAKENAAREAARIAKEAEELRIKTELEAKAKEETEAKERALQESERIAKEAEELRIKSELEAKAKKEEKAKVEQEEKRLAALKSQEEAEQAKVIAEQKAKERALSEAERIAKEAEELRIKSELEAKAKEEEKIKAEQEEKRLAAVKAHEEAEQAKVVAEQEAKERALREAERIAIEAEELRIKAEADAKKKEEEEKVVALQAELKAKAEIQAKNKEKAHLEIERVLREAEEKRKKAAKKAKDEKLEAKRKAKAEDEIVKVDLKAKGGIGLLRTTLLAEEKGKSEEKEINRITIEKIAKEAEEERLSRAKKQRKQEDEVAIEDARIKARLDEEEREKAAAKENTRAEMERISKEADAIRKPATILKFVKPKKEKKEFAATKAPNTEALALAKMEERARKEAERIAKEEQELAEIEAEEKAQENTKEFAKTVTKPVKKIKIEQNENLKQEKQIKEEKELKPNTKEAPSFKFPTKFLKAWILKLFKIVLIYLPLSLLVLVGFAHFINLSFLASPVENLISEHVKDTVAIQEVRVSLLPEPHFVLGNVSIGKDNGYKIESIYVVPTRASLFENEKVVKSAVIEGMQINQTNFTHLIELIKNIGNAERLKVEDLHLKNITINIRDVDLGVFDGKLKLSESRKLEGIDLISTDNTLNITILSSNVVKNLILNANNWALPLGPKVVFSRLSARGLANQDGINFSNITGELYGGSMNAKLLVDWSSRWQVEGIVDLMDLNTAQMLTAVNSPTLVEGKLKLSANFSSKTSLQNKIVDEADISADFVIDDGSIRNVELARAVISNGDQSLMGGDTHFDKLSGSLQVKNGIYQYRKVILQSPQFRASGYFDVMPNQLLSGKMSANLQAQTRRLQSNFTLEGTSNNARIK